MSGDTNKNVRRQSIDDESDNYEDEFKHSSEQARPSEDIRREDQEIVEDDEEAERLLTEGQHVSSLRGLFGRGQNDTGVKINRREQRQYRREARRDGRQKGEKRKSQGTGEEGELLYKMEEGAPRSSSDLSAYSDGDEYQKSEVVPQRQEVGREETICLHNS